MKNERLSKPTTMSFNHTKNNMAKEANISYPTAEISQQIKKTNIKLNKLDYNEIVVDLRNLLDNDFYKP